jgi:Putative restriction endonuclease
VGMPVSSRPQRRYTLQEFARLRDAAPPGPRYEFLDGEILVTPSPNLVHQRIVLRFAMLIGPFVKTNGLGEVVISPFDVRFADETVFQPDLLVMTAADVHSGRHTSNTASMSCGSSIPRANWSSGGDRTTSGPRFSRTHWRGILPAPASRWQSVWSNCSPRRNGSSYDLSVVPRTRRFRSRKRGSFSTPRNQGEFQPRSARRLNVFFRNAVSSHCIV